MGIVGFDLGIRESWPLESKPSINQAWVLKALGRLVASLPVSFLEYKHPRTQILASEPATRYFCGDSDMTIKHGHEPRSDKTPAPLQRMLAGVVAQHLSILNRLNVSRTNPE